MKKKPNGWFSISSIPSVPYIQLPELSRDKCLELHKQAMNVLRISIRQNNYNEVAITYNIDQTGSSKYIVTNGEAGYVQLMGDTRVKDLLNDTKKKKELAVVSLHNHPNDSFFSINDLLTFAENPSIRIMEIVNTKGEVAFLLRPRFENYHCVIDTLLDAEPNYIEKKNNFQVNHNGIIPKIADIITDKRLRIEIINMSTSLLEDNGVYIHTYVNMKNAKYIDFSNFKNNSPIARSDNPVNIVNNKTANEYNYLENGEDGYEWEER